MTHQYINDFHDSMNDHKGDYKALTGSEFRRGVVVEYEVMRTMSDRDDRARIVVWERPPSDDDPRNTRWIKRVSKYGAVDEIRRIFDSFDSRDDMMALIDEKNE